MPEGHGGAKKELSWRKGVTWGDNERANFAEDSLPDAKPRAKVVPDSLPDVGSETTYIINNQAANDYRILDVAPRVAPKITIEANNDVANRLLGDANFELETPVNLRPTTSVYTDPTTPTGAQLQAIKKNFNNSRDVNLASVRTSGGPLGEPQPYGEIPGSIRQVRVLENAPKTAPSELNIQTGFSARGMKEEQAKVEASKKLIPRIINFFK